MRETGAKSAMENENAPKKLCPWKFAPSVSIGVGRTCASIYAWHAISQQKQPDWQDLGTLALIKSMAWNLLSFRPEFGRN
jgi:hypothetical protein